MLLQTHHTTTDATKFFDQINTYLSVEDRLRVQEAFNLARREHGDQRRKSGELFFTHPLTVAYYLSQYHLDAPALEAALLHDIAEDTRVSIEEIEAMFSPEVARLVDGVTKLKDVIEGIAKGKRLPPQEIQDKTLHKLFSAMTEDVRTVVIKLFDRLHNMRTIKARPPHKQRQKAEETLAVYAPLANRLGLWKLKNELEALSLEVLHNKAYNIIKRRREELEHEQQEMYQLLSGQIFDCLLQAEIDVRNVLLAPENIYTLYQDLTNSGSSYDDIDRTIRLVVLVNEWHECYLALGHLHQIWRPVPGTFDDYIAVPLDNLYRSLHTTVVHANGQAVKLRIRTVAMDKVSEIGVLGRWLYAGTPLWSKGIADRIESFFENISENINLEPLNPGAGVKGVVEDVFRKQIRVYTPRGDIVELGQGATIIDFAYAIHTGLGNQAHAAYVNDVFYPLNKPLKDGDQVRIVKKVKAQPQRAWLDDDLGYIAYLLNKFPYNIGTMIWGISPQIMRVLMRGAGSGVCRRTALSPKAKRWSRRSWTFWVFPISHMRKSRNLLGMKRRSSCIMRWGGRRYCPRPLPPTFWNTNGTQARPALWITLSAPILAKKWSLRSRLPVGSACAAPASRVPATRFWVLCARMAALPCIRSAVICCARNAAVR